MKCNYSDTVLSRLTCGLAMTVLSCTAAHAAPLVGMSIQSKPLPAITYTNQSYPVKYQLKVNPRITKYVKTILLKPVSDFGGIVHTIKSDCNVINANKPVCSWSGTWKPTTSGKHWVNMSFSYGGVTFKGNAKTRLQSKSSQVRITKASVLPPLLALNKSYKVNYLFTFDAADAAAIKSIVVTPVASGGVFKKVSSTCDRLLPNSKSCLWKGSFKATRVGKYTLNASYAYNGFHFAGTSSSKYSVNVTKTGGGGDTVQVSVAKQSPFLPSKILVGKPYPVRYVFTFDAADAAKIGTISVTPSLGSGASLEMSSSTCGSISANATSCVWNGNFTATQVGAYNINVSYNYTISSKKYSFVGTIALNQSTVASNAFTVTVDTDFNKISVKRIKVSNDTDVPITDLSMGDSALGDYFVRYNGANGGSAKGTWCTASSCPQSCGSNLSPKSICYVYVRSTLKSSIGSEQTKSLVISSAKAHLSKTVALTNTKVLYAAGGFTLSSPLIGLAKYGISRYDGTSWILMKEFGPGRINALATDAEGNLYAGGAFKLSAAYGYFRYLEVYDGTNWHRKYGNISGNINALASSKDGYVYVGINKPSSGLGHLWRYKIDGGRGNTLYKYDNGPYIDGGQGFNGNVNTIAMNAAGTEFYVAGTATTGSSRKNYVLPSRAWTRPETGISGSAFNNAIATMAIGSNGILYAAGDFTNSANKRYVAKRATDGTWSSMGTGPSGTSFNGTILVSDVNTSNQLNVAGSFTNASGKHYVAEYSRSSWISLGDGPSGKKFAYSILALRTDADNSVYVSSGFTDGRLKVTKGVFKYSPGTGWVFLGSGPSWKPFKQAPDALQLGSLLTAAVQK